jgi:hypothetical protein
VFGKLPAAWVALAMVLTGCGNWPRFAHKPSTLGVAGVVPPNEIDVAHDEPEPASGDWPDIPQDLGEATVVPLYSLWNATVVRGELARGDEPAFGGEGGAGPPFGCTPSEIDGNYTGDIDFFRFTHQGGPLCLVLDADPGVTPEETEWDAIAYEYDGTCITGPFLTLPSADPDVPGSMTPGGKGYVAQAAAGELAVYVAGVRGSYPAGSDVTYALYLVPVPAWESCDAIALDDFVEATP